MSKEAEGVPRPPKSLGVRGAELWATLQGQFEFDPQEVELLLETCRTLDVIDALSVSVANDGVMITGSQGQRVLNAAVAELRQQQASYSRLVSQLNLLDAELGQAISARGTAAKTAAQARWREKKVVRGA